MTTYNGWTNRETWATVLHLNNDQVLYLMAQANNESDGDVKSLVETIVADVNFKHVAEDIGDLSLVNWQEVAEAMKGE